MPACSSPSARRADYFETGGEGPRPKAAANWVIGDLFGALNRLGPGIERSPVAPRALGALIDLIADGTISGRIAKDVFAEMVETGEAPAAIVERKGLRQVSDTGAIEQAVDAVLAAQPGTGRADTAATRSCSASLSARS